MSTAQAAPAKGRRSFWEAAARHQNQMSADAFSVGQPIYRPLRRSGYLSLLKINVNGQLAVTTGTQTDADAITNILPKIALRSPQGTYLISTSSRALMAFNYRMFAGVSPLSEPSYAPIVAATTAVQNINYNMYLPLSINPYLNVETGMLLRQLANNDFILELQCASSADVAGSGTLAIANGGTGVNVTVEELWFEAVDALKVVPPPFNTFCRLRDQLALSPLVAGMANTVNYPVGPVLLDALFRTVENGAAAHANIANIGLLANWNNQLQQRNGDQIRLDNYTSFGKAFPNGTFLLEFLDDSGVVDATRMRDVINSAAAAELDFLFTTKAGFNVANSSIFATFRELVPLAVL